MSKTSLSDKPSVLHFVAVDVEVQLRRVGAERREQPDESWRLDCPCRTMLSVCVLQSSRPSVAAVLDDELEAAGGAQAVDRRRAEDVATTASGIFFGRQPCRSFVSDRVARRGRRRGGRESRRA